MVKVTVARIQGESFDLSTGEAVPKAVVLTNGTSEIPLYVNDEIAMSVLAMAHGNGALQESAPAEKAEEPKKPEKPKKRQKKREEVSFEDLEDEAYRDTLTGVPSL